MSRKDTTVGRLEFEANGIKVVVEGVDPERVSDVVGGLIATFNVKLEEATVAEKPERVERDRYYVTSRSNPSYAHIVKHYGNGNFECDCEGYKHRGYCRHTVEALEKHRRRYGY